MFFEKESTIELSIVDIERFYQTKREGNLFFSFSLGQYVWNRQLSNKKRKKEKRKKKEN